VIYSISRSLDCPDGIGSLVSMTMGPVYPQSGHRYIEPVYPPIQRMMFSEWHFGQNLFVTTGLTKAKPSATFLGPLALLIE